MFNCVKMKLASFTALLSISCVVSEPDVYWADLSPAERAEAACSAITAAVTVWVEQGHEVSLQCTPNTTSAHLAAQDWVAEITVTDDSRLDCAGVPAAGCAYLDPETRQHRLAVAGDWPLGAASEGPSRYLTRVAAHEIGHALGYDHDCGLPVMGTFLSERGQ